MKTAIIYSSKYGTTKKVAQQIARQLYQPATLVNIRKERIESLSDYDLVILGSSIYAGKAHKSFIKLLQKNESILLTKRIGLFTCGMEKKMSLDYFNNLYSSKLREHSVANGIMGGEFLFDQLNFIERLVVKKVSGINSTTFAIDELAIAQFVNKINV